MARKDYVGKNHSNKKNTSTKRTIKKTSQKKGADSANFPWRVALIGLVLLLSLIFLINKLNNDPEPAPALETSSHVNQPIQELSKINDQIEEPEVIPPPPEEDWEYLSTLPNQEVEVEAKEVVAPKVPYIMQCGAYKTEQQAHTRKANIAFQGITSQVVKKSNSSWYRVILGPYTFKREAVKDQHTLQRVKIEPCFIMRANAI